MLPLSLDCVTKMFITKKELEMVKEEAAIILKKISHTFSHSHSLGQTDTVLSIFNVSFMLTFCYLLAYPE